MKYLPKQRHLVTLLVSCFFFVAVSFRDGFFEIAKQIEIFTTMFKTVSMNYVDPINPGELMDKAIKNMLTELDPYTVFFNEADVIRFRINNNGEYTGIGAAISRKNGRIIIKEIYKGYAADKAGLLAGDEITHIGSVNLEDFKEDTSQLLSGAKGSKIQLKYIRQGKEKNGEIILDNIEIKAVPFFGKIDDNTGYIALTQFNTKASQETHHALEELKNQGAKRIILDLRGNPGGLLGEAVNICNLFVPKGEIITTTKSRIEKHNNTYMTLQEPVDIEIPLVILIDGRSASASEIVAGALQDLDRAVIIGSRSFGKGLVQRPIDLIYGTQVKVTISRYYTPSGRCIQALDYTHRDKAGNAIRTQAKDYNAFRTRKGRIVYDGGGIQPDIELEESKTNAVTQALLLQDGIFNFATQYYYKHPNPDRSIPNISDNDFNELKNWLRKENFSFNTQTQKALEKTLEAAQKEQLDQEITQQYENLLLTLKKSNEIELDKNKTQIKKLLTDELILRYQYREGLYNYYLKENIEIKKAVQLLDNIAQYNHILKK